jgi:hypothetical protein
MDVLVMEGDIEISRPDDLFATRFECLEMREHGGVPFRRAVGQSLQLLAGVGNVRHHQEETGVLRRDHATFGIVLRSRNR